MENRVTARLLRRHSPASHAEPSERGRVRTDLRMSDFFVALGLVFVLEGLLFAAFPEWTKRAMTSVLEAPDGALRIVGIGSAVIGMLLIWAIRG